MFLPPLPFGFQFWTCLPAQNHDHWIRSLQIRELTSLARVICQFVAGQYCAWDYISSHLNSASPFSRRGLRSPHNPTLSILREADGCATTAALGITIYTYRPVWQTHGNASRTDTRLHGRGGRPTFAVRPTPGNGTSCRACPTLDQPNTILHHEGQIGEGIRERTPAFVSPIGS